MNAGELLEDVAKALDIWRGQCGAIDDELRAAARWFGWPGDSHVLSSLSHVTWWREKGEWDLEEVEHEVRAQIASRGDPDLTITRHGVPYLERWYIQRSRERCVYLHRFVGPDPDVGPHDHPWDSASLLIAGIQNEQWLQQGSCPSASRHRVLCPGTYIYRPARFAHQLTIDHESEEPPLTLFVTGPFIRDWGFWVERDGERRLERHPIELEETT